MNALKLQRNFLPASVIFALCCGLTNLVRGQTPVPPDPVSQAKAAQNSLEADRREQAALAAARREQAIQAALAAGSTIPGTPAPAVSTTTTTSATSDLPALRIAVASVNESRNDQGRGTLNLNLSIVGEGLPPTTLVRQITVTKAEDNLGNVLGSSTSGLSSAAAQARMMSTISMASLRGGVGPLTGQAALNGTVRKAVSLKYAEGTIELFLPSETNGAVIRIPNVLNHTGRIEDPALAKHGIEYYFLPDQASYDEARNNVAGFQVRATAPDFPNGVGYYFRDPSGRFAFQQFQDANGAMIRTSNSYSGGSGAQTGVFRLVTPLPANAQLVFFLMVPEAIKTVPFRVEDIALP